MLHLEINITRRHIYALVAAIALIVAIVPLASYAASDFTDVPDSNIFQDDINWLADAGVTLGCNPPANDEFCPEDNVRRETMAAFMRRLAENKVVDAKTAITAESAAEADVAAEADNADLLDGMDSTDFAPLPTVNEIVFTGSSSDATVGFTYEKLRDVGPFTKIDADTAIKLTWTGHAATTGAGEFCDYQLRINGVSENGSSGTAGFASDGTGRAVHYGTSDSPISVTAVFEVVPAGSRTVEIWLRGNATSCLLNRGNFPMTVVAEEIAVSSSSSLTNVGSDSAPSGTE